MKKRNLEIREDVKLRLQRIRESLSGITLDDEEMSKVSGGCGGICYVSCSYWCEASCMGSCMTFSDYDPVTGGLRGGFCALLPPQNGMNWERIIRYK